MKKLNKYILALIIVGSFAILFLAFSIGSAFYTVNRSINSIDEIGNITVDEDLTLTSAKNRLDLAITNYDKLDRDLKLEEKVDNIELLYKAKKDFVNASILLALAIDNQKVKLGLSDNDVAKYVANIEEYQKEYITKEEFEQLADYSKYVVLSEKYADYLAGQTSDSGNQQQSSNEEEIEIC